MIKIDDHINVNLDNLAEQHYINRIGVPNADGINYHSTASLIGRIRTQRAADLATPDPTRVSFWDFLLDNNFANLKRIVVSRPNVLKTMITEIEQICGLAFFSVDQNYDSATLTDFGKVVKKVFNYRIYRDGVECSDNYNQLDLCYCPYCNEQVIQVIVNVNGLNGESERRALLQLDHFYPQSRHPYFAVSFFNMIPGCATCNAQLKGEKKFDIDSHFNPFNKRLDDFFRFELDSFLLLTQNDVVINCKNILNYSTNALDDFQILQRYNQNVSHKRMVFYLIQSFKNHSNKINRSIAQQLNGLFTTESKRKVLLEKYNVPIKQNEISQIQLGKLKRDIVIQMGVLNP